MSNKDVIRCKHCGKVIVGKSKAGLCEQCFSKDAKVGGGIGFALAGLFIKFRKPIVNVVKAAAKLIYKA